MRIVEASEPKYHHSGQTLLSQMKQLFPDQSRSICDRASASSNTTSTGMMLRNLSPSLLQETVLFQSNHPAQFGKIENAANVNSLISFNRAAKRLRDHRDNVPPNAGQFIILKDTYDPDLDAPFGIAKVIGCDRVSIENTEGNLIQRSDAGMLSESGAIKSCATTQNDMIPKYVTLVWFDNWPYHNLCNKLQLLKVANKKKKGKNSHYIETVKMDSAICWGFEIDAQGFIPIFVWEYLLQEHNINPYDWFDSVPSRLSKFAEQQKKRSRGEESGASCKKTRKV